MLLLSIVHKKKYFSNFQSFLFLFTHSGNLTLTCLGGEMDHRYILFYKFLVTHPDFIIFGDFFLNLFQTNILEIIFQNLNWYFSLLYFFHEQVLLDDVMVMVMVLLCPQ